MQEAAAAKGCQRAKDMLPDLILLGMRPLGMRLLGMMLPAMERWHGFVS